MMRTDPHNDAIAAAKALLEREGYYLARASTAEQLRAAWVHLYSRSQGICFRLLDPDPALITLDTIAHGLSLENRFGSQTKHFYPVAIHCYRGSYLFDDANDAIDFLFHDASEGLGLRDLPAPVKRLPEMAFYLRIEASIMDAVADRIRLRDNFWLRPRIKEADDLMLHLEHEELLVPLPPGEPGWTRKLTPAETAPIPMLARPVTPSFAKRLWLLRLVELGDIAGRVDLADEARVVLAADQRSEMTGTSP